MSRTGRALSWVEDVLLSSLSLAHEANLAVLTTVADTLPAPPLVDVLPGAVVAAVVLEASFQALPLYVRYSDNVVALKAFGGPVLLLVWLYVMANVIVFGAEVNWLVSARRRRPELEEAPGLA